MNRPRLIQAKIALGRIQLVLDPHGEAGLKPGDHLYPYVMDNGALGSTAARLDRAPDDPTSYDSFFADNQGTFEIDRAPDHEVAREAAQHLRGTRLQPCYVDVTRVKRLGDQLLVEGMPHGLYDPRLPYLDPTEGTSFGTGGFDPATVKALWDGGYCHVALSPLADQIDAAVQRQRRAFDQYRALEAQQDPGHHRQLQQLAQEIDRTRRLLKPHAHEIYRYADDTIYFINGLGNWQAWYVPGLRTLDHHDRIRLARLAGPRDDHRATRDKMPGVDIATRHRADVAASLMEPELRRRFQDDIKVRDQKAQRFRNLKPHDGPLGARDLPGLKPGVEFFPHQALMLAAIGDEPRALGDVDAGGGKALMIICDALRQLAAGRVKRPLVVMPNSLLGQFAAEVKRFSELNPWIISTDSIARWSEADVHRFLRDAKATPPNTLFLTSYDWLARDALEVPNGEISGTHYRTHKVFPRPALLLDQVGVDGVYADECHLLKSESLRTWATTLLGRAPVFRGFTGTIMPGNLIDVTGPMGVIHSGIFGSTDDFLDQFSPTRSVNDPSPEAPKQIRQLLGDFGTVQIRKSAWADLLPKVHHETHFVSLTKNQLDVYNDLLANTIANIEHNPELARLFSRWRDDDHDAPPPARLLEKFVPLERFINAPSHTSELTHALMQGIDAVGPKARLISKIATEHLERRQGKVLVLVQYREAARALLDQLAPSLQGHAAYYDGDHIDQLERFKDPASDLRMLVGVDSTIRTGHNIQAANCVIHGDLVWLPGDMDQREARAARLRQVHEVWVHTILAKNTIEILKYARILAAQHLVAKANSDFDDHVQLKPVTMSLARIKTFKDEAQLQPYLERRTELLRQQAVHAERDKKFYGTSLLKPHGHTLIAKALPGSRDTPVPSTDSFDGRQLDQEADLAQDLSRLPAQPGDPKVLEFDIENRDDGWFLVCFRSVDSKGFLRRLGFSLEHNLWYLDVTNRSTALQTLDRLTDQGFQIQDRPDVERSIKESRWIRGGHRGALKQLEQQDRQAIKGDVAEPDWHDIVGSRWHQYELLPVGSTSSIGASLYSWEELDHLKEVPFSAFDYSGDISAWFSHRAGEKERTLALADEIRENEKIEPLIVVIDAKGPYLLEGQHRFAALYSLGLKSFPALVVLDTEPARVEAKEAAPLPTKALVLGWATTNGLPYLWTNLLDDDPGAAQALRQAGFVPRPDFWFLKTNRTKLIGFFQRLTTRFPEVKLARWSELKQAASKVFRTDLSRFDEFAK